ncbi:FtsX-like permease family protein [Microbacterium terricola]|uniref:ABC3 transporter permease C-terminal domain-containing protein n=1 Tax=Microbacterium terricola TaxID=344163 RepID=A0ABM8E101_9MICO|nr:FtsX-like permease family protein [Microbacterium terricola]UYK40831.1 hypothetical protein OAU46_04055 [Microbacterium terricola]BDV31421.1 hypothetical protein Microterr_20810 [Microbacterium terricola]
MSRTPGLFALTRRRFATPRSAALVIVALTVLAAFVIAAAPRALVGVVRDEVAHQISGVPATSRDLSGSAIGLPAFGPPTDPVIAAEWDDGAAPVLGAVGQALADNRDAFEPALRSLAGPAEFAEYAEPFPVAPESLPADAPLSLVQVLTEPTAQQHLTIVEGAWPDDATDSSVVQIVLSADAAATMKWPVGERRGVPVNSSHLDQGWNEIFPVYELAGTVEAVDPAADRWLHLPTALTATVFDDGNRRPTATSVAWVTPTAWADLASTTALSEQPWVIAWYPIDGTAAVGQEPTEMLSAFRAATSTSVPLDSTGQLRMRFSSDVVTVLSTALARTNAAGAILAVAAVGPLAVSVALVVLAATLMIRRRRTDLALLSARGAPLARLRRLLFGEGLLLGLPAAVIGAVIGVAVTPHDAGPVPTAVAVLVGLAPALALAFSLRPAVLERGGRADLDAPVRSRAARILETVVVLLAVVAVVQLVVRGVGAATEGIDPLVVVAPLLATVALALIFVRLHPLPIAATYRAARGGRGVASLVGSARSLRDPAAGTTAVLAMIVAVAIAVFSSLVLATVDRGGTAAAQRAVGGDLQLTGPYFDDEMIAAMRDVDGVVEVAGVLRGDYVDVVGPDDRASAQAYVTDIAAFTAIQQGMVGAVPVGRVTAGADPAQIVESTALAAELGQGATTLAGTPVDVVATVDRVLGLPQASEFVLLDRTDYQALTGLGFFPRAVVVDLADGTDAAAAAAALGEVIGTTHSVRILDDALAEIQASPAVTALRFVLFAALGLAVVLSVIAVLLVAGVSKDARSRVITLLRILGLDRRRGRAVVAWEFAPLGLTALVGGVVLGAVLPLLVVTSIDLRPFTGGGRQPALAVDPVLTGTLIAVVVVALALAVVAGVISARTTSMATVLRTEED